MSLKSKLKKVNKLKSKYDSVKKYIPTKTVKNVADVVTGGRVSAVMRTVSDVSADYKKVKNIYDAVKDVRSGSSDVRTNVNYSGVSKDVKKQGFFDWLLNLL